MRRRLPGWLSVGGGRHSLQERKGSARDTPPKNEENTAPTGCALGPGGNPHLLTLHGLRLPEATETPRPNLEALKKLAQSCLRLVPLFTGKNK